MRVLVHVGERMLQSRIQTVAERADWETLVLASQAELAESTAAFCPDLTLVEAARPEWLDEWSQVGVFFRYPSIFLVRDLSAETVARCFEAGADSLIPLSHFSETLLTSSVESLLKRRNLSKQRRYIARLDLALDSDEYVIERKRSSLDLTQVEFRIMRLLASDVEKIVHREEIRKLIFGDINSGNRTLDVHICSLRRKMRKLGLDIDTIRGIGYRLRLENSHYALTRPS